MIVQRWTIASSHSPWARPRIYHSEAFCQVFDACDFFFEECDRSGTNMSLWPDVLKCVYDSLRLACPEGLFEVDQACFSDSESSPCECRCTAQRNRAVRTKNNECINECEGFETTQT